MGPHMSYPCCSYTKKVIYCGTQNNVLLPVYITTIIMFKIKIRWWSFWWHGSSP
jgi:hypothetical protein